jgi:shikimate kinase
MPIPNLVLVGFMGTGKSAIGRRVASQLQIEFIDMDDLIESRQGQPISRIFATQGEPAFRALERDLVRELAAPQGRVIATGGGVVLNSENVRDFQAGGLVVCLKATPEIIFKRVSSNRRRPLLDTPNPLQRIVDLLEQRRPDYDAIPQSVDTSSLSLAQIVTEIAGLYDVFRNSFSG